MWGTVREFNSWNKGGNWDTGIAPVNAGDTATFNSSNGLRWLLPATSLSIPDAFNPGASAFSVRIVPEQKFLFFVAAGIVNNSGATQTIVI